MDRASEQEPEEMPSPTITPESPPITGKPESPPGNGTRRVNVNFSAETYEMLSRIADRKGITMSEELRQAIALEDYLEQARAQGARVLIDRNGQVNELVIR